MMVTTIVLINLLIAMMSDTYQRIQVEILIVEELFSQMNANCISKRKAIFFFLIENKLIANRIIILISKEYILQLFYCSNNLIWSGSLVWLNLSGNLKSFLL